jgi:retinol dehydrogenase 12
MDSNNKKMASKTCLVTGGTSGIGKVTASALAAQGMRVVISGRNFAKTEAVARKIIAETGNPSIHFLIADFSDLQAVRKLAKTFKEKFTNLDILVNNAGAFYNSRRRTPYGVEMTFLVNHLAPFLLTNLLLESFKNSVSGRIVNVSSDAHKYGNINLDDLEFNTFYFGFLAYARSKLANLLFTYELDRRLAGSNLTVNALHPGHVATNIFRTNFSIFGPLLKKTIGVFSLTPEQGAQNSIYLASSQEVEGISGNYFVRQEQFLSSPLSHDLALAKGLWEKSEKLTGI